MTNTAVMNSKSGVKGKTSKAGQKVKNYTKKYKDDIRDAYDIGYAKGWDNAYEIPKRVGSKTAATIGFRKGIGNRHKADKYVRQYNRKGGKNE